MVKLVTRGIAAHKGRLSLTLLSIVLGVGFVSGSFILADSLRSIFDRVSEEIFEGVDAQVRAVEPDFSSGEDAFRFDQSAEEIVAEVDGVAEYEAGIAGFEQVYTTDAAGEVVRPQGPPVIASSWGGPGALSSFTLLEGDAPAGQQIAVDPEQADDGGFGIGDTVSVSTPLGFEDFEVSGLVRFGETAGAYFILFDLPTAQRVLDAPGELDSIIVAADSGVSPDQLVANLQAALPVELEAVSGQTVIGETQDEFGAFIDIFGNILLGFALVTLFVSIFIIYNTFAILVSQRTRQLGLLRAIGASGSQVRWMVLVESVLIGLAASLIGLFLGLGVAALLKWIFSLGGGDFPDGPLQIQPRTVIVVFIVGILVTVLSAVAPAIKASRVAPLEALRDSNPSERSIRFRIIAGALVLLPGVLLLGLGLTGSVEGTSGTLSALGFGSVLTFIGVSMLSALFAGRVASTLGAPVAAVRNVVGRIARDNASRNPRRTAATATSLMIGLALITGVTVLAASIKKSFNDVLEGAVTADLFIYEENNGLAFSGTLADRLQELPEVDQAAGYSGIEVRIEGDVRTATAYDTAAGSDLIDIELSAGTDMLAADEVAVHTDKADDLGLAVGDVIEAEFEDGAIETLTVAGIYDDKSVLGTDWILERELTRQHTNTDTVNFAGLTYVDGIPIEEARASVEAVTAEFPQLTVQDNAEFKEAQEGQINQLLLLVNGLLGLCLIVAFFGIVNTMALSVLERTREIGLLRAVGMTRSQLRSSVRWEAVIVSVFGALLGVLMGVILAWAGVTAIPDEFISTTAIPYGSLVLYLGLGAVLGVIAAYFPARRAAKLDVLEAIAFE